MGLLPSGLTSNRSRGMLNKIVKSQTLNTCFLGCVQVQQNSEEHDAAGLPEQGVQLYNQEDCYQKERR